MRFYEVWKAGSVGVDVKRFLWNFLYSYVSPWLTILHMLMLNENGDENPSFIQSLKILSSWFQLPEISVSRVWTLFWCFEVFACNTWWTWMQTSLFLRETMEILPMKSINGRFSRFLGNLKVPPTLFFSVNWKNNKFDLSFAVHPFKHCEQ